MTTQPDAESNLSLHLPSMMLGRSNSGLSIAQASTIKTMRDSSFNSLHLTPVDSHKHRVEMFVGK